MALCIGPMNVGLLTCTLAAANAAPLSEQHIKEVLQAAEQGLAGEPRPALGRADKLELLEMAESLEESVERPQMAGIRTRAGEVIPMPLASEPPPPPSPPPPAAPAREEMTMRTLEDFRAEVHDLLAGGEVR